ncbi:hypothetical protein DFJ73DRAFT_830795 [Zopfochytrium polystomum]|nr:hypothetical protein DFJ73DRAFT_830795 [Zopfochytrium polystomum]
MSSRLKKTDRTGAFGKFSGSPMTAKVSGVYQPAPDSSGRSPNSAACGGLPTSSMADSRLSTAALAGGRSGPRSVFDKYDIDGSGSISVAEFRRLCYDMGYFMSDKELVIDVKMLDVDGDGEISYEEFIKWWRKDDRFKGLQLEEHQYEKLAGYLQDFKRFDKDGSGIIDVREFKSLYVDLVKKKLASKSLMATLQEIDVNKDGKVSFNEYVSWVVQRVE